jgi:hypothetical protein
VVAGVADLGRRERTCVCGGRLYGPGRLCRSRHCPEYGLIWAGDQRQKLFRNLEAVRGGIVLGAVTAPGAQELPWDERACAGLGAHPPSGRLGCRVDERAARKWNETAPARWRRLHRRAYQDTVKRCGRDSVWMVARVWEMQTRGALHVHPAAMLRSIVHVSVKLTREVGCTMRLLRLGRFVRVVWKVTLPHPELRMIDERGFCAWAHRVAGGGTAGRPVRTETGARIPRVTSAVTTTTNGRWSR